jgi:GAF domain-containing protein
VLKIRPVVHLDRPEGSRFKMLFELSRAFAQHTDLEPLLTSIVARCREMFGPGANVAVMLIDEETGELYFPYADTNGRIHMEQLRNVRIPPGVGISGAVLRSGRPELIVDAQSDARYHPGIERELPREPRELRRARDRERPDVRAFEGIRGGPAARDRGPQA